VPAAGIIAVGAAVPERSVANGGVARRLGLSEGWIERRTGVHSRHVAAEDERTESLAVGAGADALERAGLEAADVDLVLVATTTADELLPNAAPLVAGRLGADRAGAMDVGAACTGFLSALALAAAQVEAGRSATVLVIGADVMTRVTDPDDRATAALFGDGAGAVVLAAGSGGLVGRSVLGSDGAAAALIVAPRESGYIRMDGHETFKRAVVTLASNAAETVAANGLELDDIALFVLHQANGRILSAVAEVLDVDAERVLDVIGDLGNTSAASIPLALLEARRRGLLAEGDHVLLGAAGAGFTWGATVVQWGRP
jgi:3-oxoacyl-[acyl-carrier-protein] synthase-3